MPTVYKVDHNRVFTGEAVELGPKDPIFRTSILTPPPTGAGFHIWDGSKWFTRTEYPTPAPRPAPNYGTQITKLAMRNRFTFAEKVAIEEAVKTDSQVKVFLDDLSHSSYVDLSREDTQAGVNMLVQKTLLTSTRADEVLNNPVQPDEVPQ